MRSVFVSAALAVAAASVEQVHLSYTGIKGELAVDFVTNDAAGLVSYSKTGTTWTNVSSTSFNFVEIGYMHQALISLTDIAVGAPVQYRVGGPVSGFSPTFTAVPRPARGDSEVFAVFGDFGLTNDVCMDALVADSKAGVFDSVLHVGDWAYNFEDAFSITGNDFMNLMQGYAATKPVMPAAGNHEACGLCLQSIPGVPNSEGNFTQYKARLHAVSLYAGKNAGTNNNIFYSFNQGISHFIVFSAEAYLYSRSAAFLANQIAFMKADLAAVDRKATPWVVALVHKDWTMEQEAFNDFYPILDGVVDILFCGHVHYYNRYLPYNAVTGETDSASVSPDGSTYTNPKYMVNIVTGASGDIEADDSCNGSNSRPSFACSENYGYGFYTALNATHATWSFKTVKPDGPGPADFSDSLTVINYNH